MISFETAIRIRYSETDRMGYVYYGHYAQYFEVARVELFRSLGISYKALEDSGILLPAVRYSVKFFKPAYYDDEIIIRTKVNDLPKASILFEYETINKSGEIINKAEVCLAFVDKKTGRPCRAPKSIVEKFSSVVELQISLNRGKDKT